MTVRVLSSLTDPPPLQAELNDICYSLSPDSWVNPHKSMLGLGNYDINVITAALNTRQMGLVWFDKRKDPRSVKINVLEGCILNVPNNWKIGWVSLPMNRKHWIAFKKINGKWFNLDSKLKEPEIIGSDDDYYDFLSKNLKEGTKELFLVVKQSIQDDDSWRQ